VECGIVSNYVIKLITHIDAFDVVDGADHQVALQFRIDLLNACEGNGATHQCIGVCINNKGSYATQETAD
jgi:hypothetical protein